MATLDLTSPVADRYLAAGVFFSFSLAIPVAGGKVSPPTPSPLLTKVSAHNKKRSLSYCEFSLDRLFETFAFWESACSALDDFDLSCFVLSQVAMYRP